MRSGVPALASAPGNLGVAVLRRTEGDIEHIIVSSRWDSLESIKRFAGDDCLRPAVSPRNEYLLEREPNVTHYQLFLVDPAK